VNLPGEERIDHDYVDNTDEEKQKELKAKLKQPFVYYFDMDAEISHGSVSLEKKTVQISGFKWDAKKKEVVGLEFDHQAEKIVPTKVTKEWVISQWGQDYFDKLVENGNRRKKPTP